MIQMNNNEINTPSIILHWYYTQVIALTVVSYCWTYVKPYFRIDRDNDQRETNRRSKGLFDEQVRENAKRQGNWLKTELVNIYQYLQKQQSYNTLKVQI